MKPTRLYIKQHSITGLKYFGKSTRKDLKFYFGSGKKWLNHINFHGITHVKTIWISDWYYDEETIIRDANEFSIKNNIVLSEEWANLKNENGLDGGSDGSHRLNKKHSLETLAKMRKPKSNTGNYFGRTPWNKNKKGVFKHTEEMKKHFSEVKKGNPSRTNMPHSDETKKKLSIQKLGKKKYIHRITGESKMFLPKDVDVTIWYPNSELKRI